MGECGYAFNFETCDPDDLDLDIYKVESLRDLAEQFVDEGLFGDIPERLRFYIDHDAIARDLGMDYAETVIARRPRPTAGGRRGKAASEESGGRSREHVQRKPKEFNLFACLVAEKSIAPDIK